MNDCEQGLVRLIPPASIDDTTLISSNVPENDHPFYDANTSYEVGALTIVAHRIYQKNSVDTKPGVYPPDNLTQWADIGPSNRWAMFDLYKTTVTQRAESIIVEIKPTVLVNSIALLNLRGSYVDVISSTTTNGEVFRKRYMLRSSTGINGWYSFYFTRRSQKTTITELAIPAHRGATIRVEIHAPGNTAQCGTLLLGKQIQLGQLLWGYSPELNDYTKVTFSESGEATIKRGNYAFTPDFAMQIDDAQLDSVIETLARYRGIPAIWIAGQRHRVMTVFGVYESFKPQVTHGSFSDCSLRIRGFI